jgi:plastocyanin
MYKLWMGRVRVGGAVRIATASAGLAVFLGFPSFQDLAAATVSGEVRVEGDKALPDIIVYLDSADGAPSANAPASRRVSQSGRKFSPGRVVLVMGGRVAFVNDEEKEIDHNVFSLSEVRKFDVGLAQRGSVEEVAFPDVGEVKYYCSVHKNMEGVVLVVPSPLFAHTSKSGAFKIENVPAGDWVVKAFVAHRRYVGEPVSISLSGASLDGVVMNVVKKKRKK